MALPKNRNAVQGILNELEPQILGKEHKGITCNCGAVHSGAAHVVAIVPAGDSYPGQETQWYLWSVQMQEHGSCCRWSCTLDFFMKPEEIKEIFTRHFGSLPVREQNPYRLAVRADERVYDNLPAAVRIRENDNQIRFSFDWGQEQITARKLDGIMRGRPGKGVSGDSEKLSAVMEILQSFKPETYRGGPDPVLSFESTWHLDYQNALSRVRDTCGRVFFQNIGTRYDYRGEVYIQTDVIFMKQEFV